MRSLCRIFNFEDNYFIRDVAQVEEMMKALDDNEVNFPEFKAEPGKKVKPTKLAANGGWIRVEDQAEAMSVHASCDCCCVGQVQPDGCQLCQQGCHKPWPDGVPQHLRELLV